ncbi:MAG: VWA domain-containing protein [Verrucomicrobiales bacterium]|nr:VWA domain-containing protein [Verrucomicrobiales bacterium]
MDWLHPKILLLAIPAILWLIWADSRSVHPMSAGRRRALLIIRALCIFLALLCLASPARLLESTQQGVIFVVDHSRSLGKEGVTKAFSEAQTIVSKLDGFSRVGYVATGSNGKVLQFPEAATGEMVLAEGILEQLGSATNLEQGCRLGRGIFPAGSSRHLVLLSDGVETRGSLVKFAREAAVSGIKIHALGVSGQVEPDVRITNLKASQTRLTEGAALTLTATVEGSISGSGKLRLFENGIEDDTAEVEIVAGETLTHIFKRSPDRRNIYNYRVTIEGFEGRDAIPENNEALAIVDVRGKPLILYCEGEEGEDRYLIDAMAREGIQIDSRKPSALPVSLQDLAGYDAVIFSDVPAHQVGEARMLALRDYVEKLGGGFVMVGGMRSFGVGGYYRTPIEEILPVKLKAPDQEEFMSSALALVIDRSGSMAGQKIEVCKSAAIATTELLSSKDYIGVYAFDSQAHVIVPMTKVTSTSSIANQIAVVGSGGGTNIYPAMMSAREALGKVKAKIKHMIVLTDGQTSGTGYQALASQCQAEGITISTVAVGAGAQIGLLQTIAAAGGGQNYVTMDPADITRIFTQDTMVHTGRMIREEAFEPEMVESHPMLKGWDPASAPPLLGYVKTNRKATSQIPLVTDVGDPLLAHWRFGLGKVTAFTSDCKSRWAALWVADWQGYSQMWAQILVETARPPQGRHMDLRLDQEGSEVVITADILSDAGTRKNGAQVEADIFYVAANSLGAGMKSILKLNLEQKGPGLYEAKFRPDEAGVYMIRSRSGSEVVSAGYVHNPSSEVASGRVDENLLRKVCDITGGQFLEDSSEVLELKGSSTAKYVELWPYLLLAMLGLFMIDLIIRRWENLLGVQEFFSFGKRSRQL